MSEPAKPGILDRLRARFGWFDHAMRANDRYDESKGNFFAAGLTYYTIFALFPLLMVSFSVGGFMLSRRPDVLSGIDNKVRVRGARRPGAAIAGPDEFGDRCAGVGWLHRSGGRGMGRPELDGQSPYSAERNVATG